MTDIKLTQYSKTGGCGAKIPPRILASILKDLPEFKNDNLLVGVETSDDAAVYRLNGDMAIINTLDFFTPIVDDPYDFGRIAAANALSDIYAMGGEPLLALNIVAFPLGLDPQVLKEILRGGGDKVREAGALLAGGHSIKDDEPKYGLSVTGLVHPDKVLKNCGIKPGDVLILTKQLGSGIITTASKAGMAPPDSLKEAVMVMSSLNKKARDIMVKYPVNACTDVTGFGLLGHLTEMVNGTNAAQNGTDKTATAQTNAAQININKPNAAQTGTDKTATAQTNTAQINMDKPNTSREQVSVTLQVASIPLMKNVVALAKDGLIPSGSYTNRENFPDIVDFRAVAPFYRDVLYDPQTGGGLLISLPGEYEDSFMEDISKAGMETKVSVIGKVTTKGNYPIILT